MRWSRESGDLELSMIMTTFAMDGETCPLYKDLERPGSDSGSLFLQFLSPCCLKIKQDQSCLICNYLIHRKKGCIPATLFAILT